MSKILVVVESPPKGRKIEKFLGKDYVVRASFGHICDLVTSSKNRLGVDVEHDFKPIYGFLSDKKDRITSIVDAAMDSDIVYLASDPDREGEAIAFHVAQAIGTSKPIKRVHFREITKEGVRQGISNLMELDQNIYDAQQARRVLDRLVGYMVSPFLIKTFGPNMSAGRVQSVAVRLVVDREREIENFKPEEYWPISVTLSKKDESFTAKLVNKITNKSDAEKIKTELESDLYKVIEVSAEEKVKSAPACLITSSLQMVCAKKFGLAAARTMKCAQTLYEAGYVTYIRTDSPRCSPESIEMVRDWIKANGYDLPAKPNQFKTKDSAQNAHEAIRPTDVSKKATTLLISDEEKKVYSLIWEYFVASQMKPALYDTVQVSIKSSSNHLLKAQGRVLKYRGWLDISGDNDKNEDDATVKLPLLVLGDKLTLTTPGVRTEQKFTQPPSRYKEHSLIKELEKRGIGRPATYAQTMAKLTERAYVEKKKDTFHATDTGKKVVDTLCKHFNFMEYQYTADMEEQLDLIEAGKLSYLGMMKSFFPNFSNQLQKAQLANEPDYGIVCNICSKAMYLCVSKFGHYMLCSGSPVCKNIQNCDMVDDKPVLKNHRTVDGVFCPKCNGGMKLREGRFGQFYSCALYPKCNGSGKVPFGKKCSKCNINELYVTSFDGVKKLACMGYPDCKNIENIPIDNKTIYVENKNTTLLDKKVPIARTY